MHYWMRSLTQLHKPTHIYAYKSSYKSPRPASSTVVKGPKNNSHQLERYFPYSHFREKKLHVKK